MVNMLRRTQGLLDRYLEFFPDEAGKFGLLREQICGDAALFTRSNMIGHITSSAAVLTPNGAQILLIHHRFLKKWLPPGGHYEGPGSLLESALREVKEETGVANAKAHPWTLEQGIPLDIDSHYVPPRPSKGEAAHIHHDFLFIAVASAKEDVKAQRSEVHAATWVSVSDLKKSADRRVLLLHEKLARVGVLLNPS